jgi:2-polyprenyl-3-methyl-5-hydroxy-6-metoxy-1,4-benzoquinol methylase
MTQTGYVADDLAAYERQMGRWSGRLAASFVDFAEIRDAASILDVGCGTGSLAFAVARAAPGARIIGVDLSEAFVAYARSRTSDARLTFERGDAAAVSYDDTTFDAALSLLVLNFVPEAGGQCARWLASSGQAARWPRRCGTSEAVSPSCASCWTRRR